MNVITTADPAPGNGELHLLGRIFKQHLKGYTGDCEQPQVPRPQQAELLSRFCGLLRQLSALMHVSGAERSEEGLDSVLVRLMIIISNAVEADRSTLFLYDSESDELFSRVAEGDLCEEIRMPAWRGIAGTVFRSGTPIYITDAYTDPRFNPEIDEQTGYRTRGVLCVPLRNWDEQIIGVTEVLNKHNGKFGPEDQALVEALTSHAAAALESMQLYENIQRALRDETRLLGITMALSSELNLDTLLSKIMSITSDVLEADRSTLLLYDEESGELRSKVAEGLEIRHIRIAADSGIAGSVFQSGQLINIADAYADTRFNGEIDRSTGYRTQSVLCVPVMTRSSRCIGIIQVLNKKGGPFTTRDEKRLKALSAQAGIAIENARLFEDVLNARNYSESILSSLSNGVVTLDTQRRIIKANPAALRVLRSGIEAIRGVACSEVFADQNPWILDLLDKVEHSRKSEMMLDADLHVPGDTSVAVNVNAEPLIDVEKRSTGYMLIMEDITTEKRMKSTMARYMSRELSERLLEAGESILEGQAQQVTVLFSDIKNFTGMTETLGARGTVSVLNEYFSEMVDLVFEHGGMLDKYIGDAIMAVFGTPFPGIRDAENAVTVAIEMVRTLREFNRRRMLAGEEPIENRLGIATGEVIAGSIGSSRRMDYTVIGHNVNLASRLEGANKFYGTQILMTESTRRALQGNYRVRELDLVQVKGSSTPVSIFEILDGRDETEFPHPDELLRAFASGLSLYRERQWRAAAACFRDALCLWPGDGPSRLYLNRCDYYEQNPPAEDWDGVWALTHK